MKKAFLTVLISLIISVTSTSFADQDFADAKIMVVPVAGNVYMLEGPGGNIGISVGEDGVLMIDDKFAPLSDKIKKAIKSIGGKVPEFLLNTHWHGDHTDGNKIFGQEAKIIAHTNVRKRLLSKQEIKLFNMISDPQPKEALPVITFDKSVSVHFNNEEIVMVHFSQGHTDGDSVVFFKGSNVVHMGDHFFEGMFPFIDLDSGGDVIGLTENVSRIIAELPFDVKIIPGHGKISGIEELSAFYRMLLGTTEFVRQEIESKKSVEEIKNQGLPEQWRIWGNGVLNEGQWIDIVYRSLVRNK